MVTEPFGVKDRWGCRVKTAVNVICFWVETVVHRLEGFPLVTFVNNVNMTKVRGQSTKVGVRLVKNCAKTPLSLSTHFSSWA